VLPLILAGHLVVGCDEDAAGPDAALPDLPAIEVDDTGCDVHDPDGVPQRFTAEIWGQPSVSAFFSFPLLLDADAPDPEIEDEVIALLESAPAGSKVHASFFTFTRSRTADTLIAAHERGVDLNIVMDSKSIREERAAALKLRDELPADVLFICPSGDGCIGPAINHNKFLLFERLTDGSTHVVAQSSGNMTYGAQEQHNNMVVVRNDPGLYEAYLGHWTDQRNLWDEDACYYHTASASRADIEVQFFPNGGHEDCGGDPIVDLYDEILDADACAAGSSVHVAVSIFTRTAVADKLVELAEQGCDVEVVARRASSQGSWSGIGGAVEERLLAQGIPVYVFPKYAVGHGFLHSKYTIIERRAENRESRTFILTGSHNYNGASLETSDETLIVLEGYDDIYCEFLADWEAMRDKVRDA
jgi:phosphatidylserine/phosphatidylglycerophosphate/cardiolipin synthase-like enzyme